MMKNNLLSENLRYTGDNPVPTHLHLIHYQSESVYSYKSDDFDTLLPHLGEDGVNWIQVHGLQNADVVHHICQYFGIDFLIVQDILNSDHLTKIEEHDNYNVVILKLLSLNDSVEYSYQQLCIIQGEKYVLTFIEGDSAFFDDIYTALKNNVLKIRTKQSDYLLSVLLNSVMTSYMSIISKMEDDLEDMEESFLSINSDKKLEIADIQIFRINYRRIKKCIYPLKEQINKLFHAENKLFHKVNRPFFNDVNDHLQFVLQTLDGCRDLLSALVDLYISQNDQRMNSIMKQLTIVSTIFIPLTFLAGIWGMNFKWIPELEWEYGYFFAWGVMAFTAVAVFIYLKYKKFN